MAANASRGRDEKPEAKQLWASPARWTCLGRTSAAKRWLYSNRRRLPGPKRAPSSNLPTHSASIPAAETPPPPAIRRTTGDGPSVLASARGSATRPSSPLLSPPTCELIQSSERSRDVTLRKMLSQQRRSSHARDPSPVWRWRRCPGLWPIWLVNPFQGRFQERAFCRPSALLLHYFAALCARVRERAKARAPPSLCPLAPLSDCMVSRTGISGAAKSMSLPAGMPPLGGVDGKIGPTALVPGREEQQIACKQKGLLVHMIVSFVRKYSSGDWPKKPSPPYCATPREG